MRSEIAETKLSCTQHYIVSGRLAIRVTAARFLGPFSPYILLHPKRVDSIAPLESYLVGKHPYTHTYI